MYNTLAVQQEKIFSSFQSIALDLHWLRGLCSCGLVDLDALCGMVPHVCDSSI